jgi:hypothetical protein
MSDIVYIVKDDDLEPVKFSPGEIVLTRSLWNYMGEGQPQRDELMGFLFRHLTGDWGDLCDEDKQANERAISDPYGARILSKYALSTGEDIYIITEADRSATTLLLTSEY